MNCFLNAKSIIMMLLCIMSIMGCSTVSQNDTAAHSTTDVVLIANPYQPEPRSPAFTQDWDHAQQLMVKKKWSQAHTALQSMITQYPNASELYLALGQVHEALGTYEQAEQAYLTALTVKATNNHAYDQLATFYRIQGDFTLAETMYVKAIQVWPDNVDAIKNLGLLYDVYLNQFDQAEGYYQRALELDPDNHTLQAWLTDLQRRQSN